MGSGNSQPAKKSIAKETRSIRVREVQPAAPGRGIMQAIARARVAANLDQHEIALKLFEYVLEKQRADLGGGHPNSITTDLGGGHPNSITTRFDMANLYLKVGNLEEAFSFFTKVVVNRRECLVEDHPDTLKSQTSLADIMIRMGQNEESLNMNRKTLEAQMRVLGPDHEDSLRTMHDIGRALHELGQLDEAIKNYEDVIERKTRVSGEDALDTSSTKNRLALILVKQGTEQGTNKQDTLVTALNILEKVASVRKTLLGEDHTDTQATMKDIAGVLSLLGREEEALLIFEKLFEQEKRASHAHGEHGEDTEEVLDIMNIIAAKLLLLDKNEEADKMLNDICVLKQKKIDRDISKKERVELLDEALDLCKKGEIGLALDVWKSAVEMQKLSADVGPDHSATLHTLLNMATAQYSNYHSVRKVVKVI